ncbi:MAG: hypothetical protein M5U26_06975 [Planctomycetota bacterium]|nr:hypothetical protein [Planctomycetota bacterium]
MDDRKVALIVERVVARLRQQGVGSGPAPARAPSGARAQAATTCYRDSRTSPLVAGASRKGEPPAPP